MNEITQNISKLIQTFNDKRVISEGEIKEVLRAIVAILAENKKSVEALNDKATEFLDREAEKKLKEVKNYIETEHQTLIEAIRGDLRLSKEEVAKATKEQNNRAFKRLQELIAAIRMPADGTPGVDGEKGVDGRDGRDGKDGSPDKPEEIRDKLETLKDEERLDAKAIKGWEKIVQKLPGGKLLVGGIRFFENLADVSIIVTKKRQDLIAQYNTTNNRWENGIAITVSASAPSSPQTNDLWVDLS